jgi:hypothetical protein
MPRSLKSQCATQTLALPRDDPSTFIEHFRAQGDGSQDLILQSLSNDLAKLGETKTICEMMPRTDRRIYAKDITPERDSDLEDRIKEASEEISASIDDEIDYFRHHWKWVQISLGKNVTILKGRYMLTLGRTLAKGMEQLCSALG